MKLVQPLPKSWLIHDVEYRKFTGRDGFGDYEYADSIQIKNVRYDKISSLSRAGVESNNPITGVLYIDARNSINIPNEIVVEDLLYFHGVQLTVVAVIPCYHPEANIVHHYEIEVS